MRKRKQASLTRAELPPAGPRRGEENLADRFPAHGQGRGARGSRGAGAAAPGRATCARAPAPAGRGVGRQYVQQSIQWPCGPRRPLPLLHNVLTWLQQEPK